MENNRIEVNVDLDMSVFQAGEMTHTKISEPGKFTRMGNAIYLQFNESMDHDDHASILVKITENGDIHLKREAKSTNLASMLYFTNQDRNAASVYTEYGVMQMNTYTKDSLVEITDEPLHGKINIDYDLIYDNNIVGNYKFRLIFSV
ncbi:DUF1934 domain-containing protein [Companilactobacillus ginsenosidimutans]|uniref:DUF1934 domain-containing protein n=1 Tax=Companilactobacillus ginsenosidimutans TaxID=1007676 RepID=A0A0H4QJ56_9LACO|nr:DUF1934 domain-containing protein [Companilactobacillus ginsenosidimutans]AKP67076.1 hypothetical protein ABM34_05675 [Companilactobacillus ginsenosidimutans]